MTSDSLVVQSVLDHPRAELWDLLGDPLLYPRFFRGITFVERVRQARQGMAAEYLVRGRVGIGDLVEFRVRPTTIRPGEKLVLAVSEYEGSWVSVTLTDASPARTHVEVRIAKPAKGLPRGLNRRRSEIEAWVRDGLNRVAGHLAGAARDAVTSESSTLRIAKVLIRAGILKPGRPDIGIRQLRALGTWGFTMAGAVTQAAIKSPDRIALVDDRGARTYAELHDRTDRLAARLTSMGIGADSTVAVLARNHCAMAEVMIGCAKVGADQVLLNTGLASRPIEETVRRHRVAVLFADDEFESLTQYLPDDLPRVSTSAPSAFAGRPAVDDLVREGGSERPRPPRRPGHLIVLTSGTSGTPKGAKRPEPHGWLSVAAVLSRIPLTVEERTYVAAPLFHSWGLGMYMLSLALRSTVVLQDTFDPEACLQEIATHRCTSLIAVPIMLQRMLCLPEEIRGRYDTSSLRVVASSGAALPGPLVTAFMDAFGDVLYNFYGSTEVSQATIADPAELRAAPTTAGCPPLGASVAILDEDGTRAPHGAVGRIYVGNEQPFDGYTSGEAVDVKESLMDTGDVGYVDADGRLFVSGRDDEMIVSGGENVFPRPVEEALAALPQVGEVAVVGVPDEEFGQRLAAFIVVRPGSRLDADMVRGYVHHRLTRFSVPRDVTFLDRLPRNTTGKVVKRFLVDPIG